MEVSKSDAVLDIDVLPNRMSDASSHYGMARELSAILGTPLKSGLFRFSLEEDSHFETKDFADVSVQDKKHCFRYCGKVILNVPVGESPKWMKERLSTAGIGPVNSVVDVTNYVMLEIGQPMHAFDLDKIIASSKKKFKAKISVRKAKALEEIHALDGKKYLLEKGTPVIAGENALLAVAGVKGGTEAGITEETKRIFLEAANFDPAAVQQSSRDLDLRTDSSVRFEHGLDTELAPFAVEYAASLLQELYGKGKKEEDVLKVCGGMIDISHHKRPSRTILLDIDYAQNLLGAALKQRDVREILERLGCSCKEHAPHVLKVNVPSWRLDLVLPEDLIEEVGRIHGYHKISALFPLGTLVPPAHEEAGNWERTAKTALKESGFLEVLAHSFVGEQTAHIFGYKTSKRSELVEVENPISSEYQYLRPSLLPNLLECVRRNLAHEQELRLFEVGKVFSLGRKNGEKDKTPSLSETRQLALAVRGENFYYAKGVLESLLHALGISDVSYVEYKPGKGRWWVPKRSAEVRVEGKEVGVLGHIAPHLMEGMKMEGEVIASCLDFDRIREFAAAEREFRPVSRYPSAVRDIAVLVPRQVKVGDILNAISFAGAEHVRDVDVFDIYEGERIPGGMKNIAFHVILQAEDHTLSPREIEECMRGIISALEKKKWKVRRQEHT